MRIIHLLVLLKVLSVSDDIPAFGEYLIPGGAPDDLGLSFPFLFEVVDVPSESEHANFMLVGKI